jgi:hypothetical protein
MVIVMVKVRAFVRAENLKYSQRDEALLNI